MSVPFTTMRCAALCFGWHANNVIVGFGVGIDDVEIVGLHDLIDVIA